MPKRYDAIIIGTGQAAPALANRLNEEGLRVAVVERDRIGGTCVNTGCTPTKALVASARAAHMARRGEEFGVVLGETVGVNMKKVNARMKAIAGRSNENVTNWLEGMENVDVCRGHGRFEGPDTVRVDDEILQAARIFINVGTRAFIPEFGGLDRIEPMTNSGMMDIDFLPDHLVVIGGSYIGLEFGQMFRRFGSEVTIVEKSDRLITRDDEDVSGAVRQIVESEGVTVRLNAECIGFDASADQVRVRVACSEGPPEVVGSHTLLAVGRVPNTDDLGLEKAGIEASTRGFITVDDELRTNVPGVWALGDCNGRGAFTHTSYNDFEIVTANLFDGDSRRLADRIPCYGLFIDPPLGRIGMTEREARESGRKILVGKRLMKHVGRARERSETAGFIKILVDAETEEILGAAILGINGDEAIHTLLAAMYAGAPYTVVSRAVHIHPTVAELLPTVLQNLEPLE